MAWMKVIEIKPILASFSNLTIFTLKIWAFTEFNEKLWDFIKVYKSLQKLMKAMIFDGILSVKSLTFVPFCSFAMYFVDFCFGY
jgi:hypothetical protein